MEKKIVHLKCYKPKGGDSRLMYDEHGKVTNDNQIIKLIYGGLEWLNNLKNLRKIGFFKIDVVNSENVDIDVVRKEIEGAMNFKEKAKLTPDQKRIQELEETLKEVLANMNGQKEVDPTGNDIFNEQTKRGRKPKE